MKPIIGVVCAYYGKAGGDCEWDNYNFVEVSYIQKLKDAGAIPFMIPVRPPLIEDIPSIIGRLDGLLFIGGLDIHPYFYNEEPTIKLGKFDYHRDQIEIALAKYCIDNNFPVLGICRGMQVVNVAAGGDLYQDIYTQMDANIQHTQRTVETFPTHHIKVHRNSFLYKLYGNRGFVNSHHHQAVRRLADGFQAIAWSDDNVIEGIVHYTKNIRAVQWHPELMDTKEALNIFKGFIESISKDKE